MNDITRYTLEDIPQQVKDFLEEIIRSANITSLDQKIHDDLLVELYTRLDDYMLSTIMDLLPSDKLEEFTKLAEEGKSREELQQYLQVNVPNSIEIFAQTMIDFRNLYLENVGSSREQQEENAQASASNNTA